METGASLAVRDRVPGPKTTFHVQVKQELVFLFCTLSDKVWRRNVSEAPWELLISKKQAG